MCQTDITGLQTQEFANKPHQKVEKLHISRGFYTRFYGMESDTTFSRVKYPRVTLCDRD